MRETLTGKGSHTFPDDTNHTTGLEAGTLIALSSIKSVYARGLEKAVTQVNLLKASAVRFAAYFSTIALL